MKSLLAVALLCFLLNNIEASTKEALCGGRSYFCPLSSISIISVVYIHDNIMYIFYPINFCLQHAKQLLMKFSIKSRILTQRRPLTLEDEKREQFVMQEARHTSLNSQRMSGMTLVVYCNIKKNQVAWNHLLALYLYSMNVMLALMLLTLTCVDRV